MTSQENRFAPNQDRKRSDVPPATGWQDVWSRNRSRNSRHASAPIRPIRFSPASTNRRTTIQRMHPKLAESKPIVLAVCRGWVSRTSHMDQGPKGPDRQLSRSRRVIPAVVVNEKLPNRHLRRTHRWLRRSPDSRGRPTALSQLMRFEQTARLSSP